MREECQTGYLMVQKAGDHGRERPCLKRGSELNHKAHVCHDEALFITKWSLLSGLMKTIDDEPLARYVPGPNNRESKCTCYFT